MDTILSEFQDKLKGNTLTEQDFLNPSFINMFHGKYDTPFVRKIADCTDAIFECGEDKYIYHIFIDGEWEVRLDFKFDGGIYRLSNLDSYTLPLKKIDKLPFNRFEPLPQRQEIKMREEYRITKMVNDFIRLKDMLGKAKALDWFKDGQGEKTGVPAWMPYFTKRKAFVAYSAWIQNRLYGEDVYITKFSEEESELLFKNSTWLFLYKVAGHLKHMICYEEYMELYETIWKDRAVWNGCRADIVYDNSDIYIRFYSE